MPREKEGYRDELEQLLGFFGDRRVLNSKDVARYTGRDYRWCQRTYGIETKTGISVVTLARKLCQ